MSTALHPHTISTHYVRALLGGAQRRRIDIAPLLHAAGIPSDALSSPDARVFPDQVAALVQALWTAMDDEFLGLSNHPCRPGAFGLMARAAIHEATLGDAFAQCLAFYRYFSPGLELEADARDDRIAIRMRGSSADPASAGFFNEFLLLAWSRFANWLAARHVRPLSIALPGKCPAHHAELDYLFGCDVFFGAEAATLYYATDVPRLPVMRAADELPQLLDNLALAILQKPVSQGTYTRRLRRVLNGMAMEDWPDIPELASILLMSERTLRRKLADEETSVQHIKDQIRRDRAIALLRQRQLSVAEIAVRVGFTEASAFIRAFKLWTGASPGHYQRDLILPGGAAQRIQS